MLFGFTLNVGESVCEAAILKLKSLNSVGNVNAIIEDETRNL